MANPITVAGFPDILDPRFREITDGEYALEQDLISKFYSVMTATQMTERVSALVPMGLYSEFGGLVTYDGPDQGYDANTTIKEYAKGVTVERLLMEFDQFNIIEGRFKLLARSALQTRQIEAAATFTNAFIVDSGYTHTEGVAMCSDSHTTTRAGVSTTTGFDNLTTAALSKTALKAAWIQGRKFKDDAGQPIDSLEFDTLVVPVDLRDTADEMMRTTTGLDTAEGNVNVLKGRYSVVDWIRLTDVNNWFLIDNSAMKDSLYWFDRTKPEFARVEEFDTIMAKYRGYYSCMRLRSDWRWCLGASVS